MKKSRKSDVSEFEEFRRLKLKEALDDIFEERRKLPPEERSPIIDFATVISKVTNAMLEWKEKKAEMENRIGKLGQEEEGEGESEKRKRKKHRGNSGAKKEKI